MARRKSTTTKVDESEYRQEIVDTPAVEEMSSSFLSYAMSVIVSRALPDVRDGLKPVHRRILYSMYESGLRPDRSHVKSARVVGDCFVRGALVHTPGGLVPIEDLNIGDLVLSPDGRAISVVQAYENPPDRLVSVNLDNGYSIKVTPGQLFKVVNDDYTTSWCRADQLAGKRVLSNGLNIKNTQVKAGMSLEHMEAYTLGILVSEGCQVHRGRDADGRTQFNMVDEEPADLVTLWAKETGLNFSRSKKVPENPSWQDTNVVRLARHPRLLEATREKSAQKHVPGHILADRELWVPFLAGYFDGDGYVRKNGNEIVMVSISARLIGQLRSMLMDLGIPAGIWHRPATEEGWYDLHGLTVTGSRAKSLAHILSPHTQIGYKVQGLNKLAQENLRSTFNRHEMLPNSAMMQEFSTAHLGAGWFRDVSGKAFRQALDARGPEVRYGKSVGRTLNDREFPLTRALRDGWVDKLERIGSPLAKRLRELNGYAFLRVESITVVEELAPTFDIQVEDSEHAFLVEGFVVHNCMGKLHPHGDSAIYEALVRMAQDFSMRIPTVDGHGNFGTHADGAAAMRYTECRMAPAAVAMTEELGEDTVDFVDNYDGKLKEPSVMPSKFPNLLVNGSSGIAVGMATNMAPHNLGEVVDACKHVLDHPDATTEDLIKYIPGPDFPTGGLLVGNEGALEAYRTGKGQVYVRARTELVDVTARKRGIMVTELPYQVGPEKVMARIKEVKDARKLDAVTGVVDLSDRKHGLRLLIELRSGVNEAKVLRELYRLTPMQESFSIHNLALVDNVPQTLTLAELVKHYVNHRLNVTRRRCEYRRARAQERAHLLEGYLIALADIDEVVKVIRASKDTNNARTKLMASFVMSEIQATAVLEMPLRRLTSLEVNKIKAELAALTKDIKELTKLLSDDKAMRSLVARELDEVVAAFGNPRRTGILGAEVMEAEAVVEADPSLEIPDEPTIAWLTAQGMLGRAPAITGRFTKMDAMKSWVATSTRSQVGIVSSTGRIHTVPVYELVDAATSKSRGVDVGSVVELADGEKAVAVVRMDAMLALVSKDGLVKRVAATDLPKRTGSEVFTVKEGDEVVAAFSLNEPEGGDLILVSDSAQLLRTPLAGINPKGAKAGGMAGMGLSDGAKVIAAAVAYDDEAVLVTCTDQSSVKVTPLAEYPVKGRGGQGVRCHKFLKGENLLVAAMVGPAAQISGVSKTGALAALPTTQGRRDGSGTYLEGLSGLVGLPPK